jgi:hypothetical protein
MTVRPSLEGCGPFRSGRLERDTRGASLLQKVLKIGFERHAESLCLPR